MPSGYEDLSRQIRDAATDADLVVFNGIPDLSNVPSVLWREDWQTFIDTARKAGAALLYFDEYIHDPDTLIEGLVTDQDGAVFDEEDVHHGEATESSWLRDRLYEACKPWNVFRDSPALIECVWFNNGVAHRWRDEPTWAADFRQALQAVLDESGEVDKRERVSRSDEAAQKLQAYAYILAIHPRFPEAKSEEKRTFMAERMFADDLQNEPASHQIFPHSIARRASLIYWWDIEPGERVTIEERVRELKKNGESIKNIAAVLKISETKVRAALKQ